MAATLEIHFGETGLQYLAFAFGFHLKSKCTRKSPTLIRHLFKSSFADLITESKLSLLSAAAAKSLQLCPTLLDRIDGSPPGSTVPEILQARTLEWVAISFSNA